MKILMVTNRHLGKHLLIEELVRRLQNHGVEVLLDDKERWERGYDGMEAIIVPGGDGSMVRAARRHLRSGLPIWGINLGTVGFLSQMEIEDVEQGIQSFLAGEYWVDERMMLEVEIQNMTVPGGLLVLNELCLRSADGKVLNIDLKIAGAGCGSYRGDGLIVTTPTGSTAYSLSCGGSIIEPTLELFGITPIASYLLAQRPVVVSAERSLELRVANQRAAYVLLDGQIRIEIEPQQAICIRKAPWKLKMAHLKGSNFFAEVVAKRLKRIN
ncbi:MAG: NAD(+)/NADH kinase [Syntrophomonadaceae bacterium]|nr:NAD(+)/NADH kinase [Syntrophomonadaceae bacterium]